MGHGARRGAGTGAQISRQKKKQVEDASVLLAFDQSQPIEEHTFEKPATVPEEMRQLYEGHKMKVSGYRGPYVVRTSPEEDAAMFLRMRRLPKRQRLNPARNVDLMPSKDIIEEADA